MIVPGIQFVQGRNDYADSDGRKYGICIHNTSNDATAEGEASYATRRTDGTSSHFYVDADSVVQSLDTASKAGHAGSTNANENAISVEITGTNEKTREWWLANVAWTELGRVLALVIRHHWPDGSFQVRRATVEEMKTNPKVKAFYSHNDCRLAWGGTTHDDPGPNFPWDKLFATVNTALGLGVAMTDTVGAITEQWRILSLLTLDPAKAAYKDIPVGARMTTVPMIDLLKRVDHGVAELLAKEPTGGVDVAALAAAVTPLLAEALRPIIVEASEAAVRKVLGSVDETS